MYMYFEIHKFKFAQKIVDTCIDKEMHVHKKGEKSQFTGKSF